MISDKQVVVNGLLTHYRQRTVAKSKDHVLFLHGWGDSATTFTGLQNQLNVSTIAVDLPGFGGTNAPKEVWGLNDYANFVGAFLAKTEESPRVIIGHSNGGAIAIRGLANGSLTSQSLILLASAGIRDQYKGKKKVLRLAAKGAKLLTKPLPKSTQTKLKKKAYSVIGSDLFVAEHLQETFKKVVTDDIQLDAAKVSQPTLLIYGENDTATPVRYGELLRDQMKQGKLVVLPDAGHFIHHDQAEQVTRHIAEFIG
jgi:pimeloyl-ACP methyl ester carboxylesterase